MMQPRSIFRLILAVALVVAVPPVSSWPSGPAWADDDGGDDGGGDGDDGGGGQSVDGDRGGEDRRVSRTRRYSPGTARAGTPATAQPVRARDEIVALNLSDADLATLIARGFAVLETLELTVLSATPRRLAIPRGATPEDARATVRALPSGQDADFNHFYRSEQGFPEPCLGIECPARHMIAWPQVPDRATACGASVRIGMVDTGINSDHDTFAGARLRIERLDAGSLLPSRALHGTAVAALLVGDPSTRSPGLVPGSELVAVDAFHLQSGDERADLFGLVTALGRLAEAEVRVINLSLAGPENAVLEEVVSRLAGDNDIVLVAATGNDGPRAGPRFPAAYPAVIAVTAVDRQGAVYRRAVQGEHVDLAAPGVDVWTAASVSGARHKTGTSFAAPFVTAAAAMLREAEPGLSAADVARRLKAQAGDLGAPGPDPVFGAGLLNIAGLCGVRA